MSSFWVDSFLTSSLWVGQRMALQFGFVSLVTHPHTPRLPVFASWYRWHLGRWLLLLGKVMLKTKTPSWCLHFEWTPSWRLHCEWPWQRMALQFGFVSFVTHPHTPRLPVFASWYRWHLGRWLLLLGKVMLKTKTPSWCLHLEWTSSSFDVHPPRANSTEQNCFRRRWFLMMMWWWWWC